MKKSIVFALFTGWWLFVCAGPFSLDISLLDIESYRVYGPGTDTACSNGSPSILVLANGEDYTIDLGENGQLVCQLQISLNALGRLRSVNWRLEQPNNFEPLPSDMYSLSNSDHSLTIQGVELTIDVSATDHGMIELTGIKQDSNLLSGTGGSLVELGRASFRLLPGRYQVETGSNMSFIYFDVDLNGEVGENLLFLSQEGGEKEALGQVYFDARADTLHLLGQPIDMVVNPGASCNLNCNHWELSKSISPGDSVTLKLLPGNHCFGVFPLEGGGKKAIVLMEVRNSDGNLSPTTYWKDTEGNRTEGEFEEMESGSMFMQSRSATVDNDLPPPEVSLGPGPYARLKDLLDESYYPAYYGKLWVKYDERYAEGGNLDIRVFDLQNQAISIPALAKDFGTNWLKLTLSNNDFTAGEFYILEVRNVYGDLGTLKFQYK